MVQIDQKGLSDVTRQRILALCHKTNMVIYQLQQPQQGDKHYIRELGRQLGLERLDGNLCADDDSITSLQVMDSDTRHAGYIPYTNRPLSWHTDGYYNLPEQQIRAILMHCVRDAVEGGENLLLDHEIAYIQLRDQNPEYIKALMRPDVMTIPPNVAEGQTLRTEQSGPVFSVDEQSQSLHMRFSARMRNIVWHDDDITRQAVAALNALLNPENPYVFRYRLKPGEGIICNNVLHNRTGFSDDPASGRTRLLYRARYYDRVHDDY
ncbi:MAG: taurine catabolism dioxygenase TauD [Gammaproteobacteria bacterium]|nr:MAG: taurine catabolism dioxygenase TauD [Gammaproteobacteria bacterium]